MKKICSFILAVAMVSLSFSLISLDASPEEVTGPFVARSTGYPTSTLVLDQEQANYDYSCLITNSNWHYQTFKPNMNGNLDHVSLYIMDVADAGYIQVDIYNTDQAGNLLAPMTSASFDAFIDGWWDVSFDPAPLLSSGMEYAILVSSPSTREICWYAYGDDMYLAGQSYASTDWGGSWIPENSDLMFRTYMEVTSEGIKKIAWHESGGQAWGVTGDSEHVYAYSRDAGTWSTVFSAVSGDIFHDIVYDDVRHMFYIVGESGGWPIAFTWDGTNGFLDRGSPSTMGAFYGVEPCYGYDDYYFLAVGRESGDGMAYAAWFNEYSGYEALSGFSGSDETLYDATWDYVNVGSYFMVGVNNTGGTATLYICDNPGDSTAHDIMSIFNPGDYYEFKAIDWCPDYVNNDYAIIVGSGPTAAAWMLESGAMTPLTSGFTGTLEDVNWFPDGSQAVIVGENSGSGKVYTHSAGSNTVADASHLLPSGASTLYGVACKGPSSPSSAIITGTGGGISFYPSALNQGTTITVNAVVPKMYSIDFIDSDSTSRLDDQVAVDEWYNFTCVANYSQGWENCSVEVRAWHDGGAIEADVGGSNYPAESDRNRTLAFTITWTVGNANAAITYPNGPVLEVLTGAVVDSDLGPGAPGDPENTHEVFIPVYFGKQLREADGSGFTLRGVNPLFGPDKNVQLIHRNSWDFNVTMRDVTNPTATNVSYAEFGIEKTISISVSGNPSGSAPPGTTDKLMTTNSNIIYSANTGYWVNVSIPHLYQNGLIGATNLIGAENVSVRNIHLTANATNSYISAQTHFPAAQNSPMNIWGRNATALPPIGNGTVSAGPWVTDYNAGGSYDAFTEMQWWVTVAASVPEGVYIAIITITVDS